MIAFLITFFAAGFVTVVLMPVVAPHTYRLLRKGRNDGHRQAPLDADRRAPDPASAAAFAELTRLAGRVGTPQAVAIGSAVAVEGAGDGAGVAIPDFAEPILAWRGWKVDGEGFLYALNGGGRGHSLGMLTGYEKGPRWAPRKTERAGCALSNESHAADDCVSMGLSIEQAREYIEARKAQKHDAPAAECRCGYYAARNLEDIQTAGHTYAFGIVALWGRVEEHEGGYRAEYAYPLCVVLANDPDMRAYSHGPVFSQGEAERAVAKLRERYGIKAALAGPRCLREWSDATFRPLLPEVPIVRALTAGEPHVETPFD